MHAPVIGFTQFSTQRHSKRIHKMGRVLCIRPDAGEPLGGGEHLAETCTGQRRRRSEEGGGRREERGGRSEKRGERREGEGAGRGRREEEGFRELQELE